MKNDKLFTIGEVSRITGSHVKSLRYYDRIGVFKPAYIDPNTDYRYYTFDQLQKMIAVRICLDNGIVLNSLPKYMDNNTIDYTELLEDACGNIDRQLRRLEKMKTYLDFLRSEVDFNDQKGDAGQSGRIYGSIALWAMPYDGDIDSFDRKKEYLKIAENALHFGYNVFPLYFGLLTRYTGTERRTYVITCVEDFLEQGEDHENILRTPEAWYRRVTRPDLDTRAAEELFPDLFAMDYDKVVLTTVSLNSSSEDLVYSMFINLPE